MRRVVMESSERIVSLRVVLSLIIGIIVVIVIVSVCVVAYFSAFNAEKSVYLEELQNFTTNIKEQVDSFYQDNLNEAQVFANIDCQGSGERRKSGSGDSLDQGSISR
jgi:hypothetical protein